MANTEPLAFALVPNFHGSIESFSILIKQSIYKSRKMFKLCYCVSLSLALARSACEFVFVCDVQTIVRAPTANDKFASHCQGMGVTRYGSAKQRRHSGMCSNSKNNKIIH